uniref:Uncharacterized protein n=1 Tax=Tanacetum cinerariifolium TaxID=118510 RepID=A0A6L2K8D5_TANCI|nr:hypothetical protein [Tanacetum cinerariifolium]
MIAAREIKNQGNAEEHGDEEEHGNGNNAAEEHVTAVDDVTAQSTQSLTPLTPPPQQPQDIPTTSHVQSPPLQQQSLPPAQPQGAHFPMSLLQEALDACAALTRRVEHLEQDKRIESSDDTHIEDMSNQERMIDESEKDEGAELMNEKETEEVRVNPDDAQVEGRHADIYHIDMDHAIKVLNIQEDEPEIQEAVEVVTTGNLIIEVVATVSKTVSAAVVVQANVPAAPVNAAAIMTIAAPVKVVVPSTKKRREVVIKDPEVESSAKTPTETTSKDKGKDIDWEAVIDHVKQRAKEEPFIQRYQVMKKRPQTEAQARRNMMMYLKNTAGFILDFFKGMSYDDIQATPLARKVPVVDYQIIHVDNKPRYKIIRADDTHQLYRSFITMLKIFDREDLETLWNIVKERFSTSKPNNFSDEYLLSTLKMMFGRPDGQDNVWKDQRSVHGQALVKS